MSQVIAENRKAKVGILGGGQLSRMLVESAQRMGLEPIPFCAGAKDPAAQICKDFAVGHVSDAATLGRFFEKVHLVAFESDFLPFENLKSFSKINFVPKLQTIEFLSDKLRQKELLVRLKIPTPEYEIWRGNDSKSWMATLVRRWQNQFVLKWARGGYDGKGVFLYKGDLESAIQFCEGARSRSVEVFAERRIDFIRELAQISVFSSRGEIQFYPLVVSEQLNGICNRVMGPADILGVSGAHSQRARESAEKIARDLDLIGTFAIEFFESHDGALLVNELAPRVHNSGHFSQDAAETSQFENHWRALLGQKLGGTKTAPAFAMQNLISPSFSTRENISKLVISSEAYKFHWYGKSDPKPGRKMGHINLVCSGPKDLEENLPRLKELEREWLARFGV